MVKRQPYALRAPLLRASDGVPSPKFSFSNEGCPVTRKPATKTSTVAGLLEAQVGCRVEGGVLRVGVRRREGRPGGRGSWVGQVLSPKGRPWIRPGEVVALRLARHGHLQAPMPSVLTRLRPWGVAGSGSSRRRRRLCRCRARALTAPVRGSRRIRFPPNRAQGRSTAASQAPTRRPFAR